MCVLTFHVAKMRMYINKRDKKEDEKQEDK